MARDRSIRRPQPEAERINVPAILASDYWRCRMRLGLDDLAAADGFNRTLAGFITAAGR